MASRVITPKFLGRASELDSVVESAPLEVQTTLPLQHIFTCQVKEQNPIS